MAAINAFRRSVVPVSKLVEKLLFNARPASVAASRPFSTSKDGGPDDLSSLISDNNSGDAKGPAGLNKGAPSMMVIPVFKDSTGAMMLRDMTEDAEAVQMRIDFPGLGKEDVEVTVENNKLMIGGKGLLCRNRFTLPPEQFRMDQIRAQMKDGVLKIVLPKVKQMKLQREEVFKVPVK